MARNKVFQNLVIDRSIQNKIVYVRDVITFGKVSMHKTQVRGAPR